MEFYKLLIRHLKTSLKKKRDQRESPLNKDSNKVVLFDKNKRNPITEYYVNEIIRKLNSINFILKKTIRSLKDKDIIKEISQELLILLIYQFFWEKKSKLKILNDLNQEFPNENYSLRLNEVFSRLHTFSWKTATKGKDWLEKMSLKTSNPSFLITKLKPYLSQKNIENILIAMDSVPKDGDFSIRIKNFATAKPNAPLNNDIQTILEDLKSEGIQIQISLDKNIPFVFNIPNKNKADLLKSRQYSSGNLIVQDKASVAAAYFLDPKPGEYICDLCAAPGMKTDLINDLSNGESTIIANDYSLNRLENMKDLLNEHFSSRSKNFTGQNRIQLTNFDGLNLPIRNTLSKGYPENLFDRVLIDAPCTGSGTFGTNPELKWRQNQKFLSRNVFLQEKLLEEGFRLLKTGGILLYSTCSLYAEEGELQIKKILDKVTNDNVKKIPLENWISPPYKIKNMDPTGMGRFFPNIHGTNGFFITKLQKQ